MAFQFIKNLVGKKKEEKNNGFSAQEELERLEFTEDASKLDRRQYHRIFIYDSMMRGKKKSLPEGSPDYTFMAGAFTLDLFSMWIEKSTNRAIPLLGLHFHGAPLCQIKGELWAIRPDVLKEFDLALQNGVYYERKRIKITVPMRLKEKIWDTYDYEIKAWMYVGKDHWRDEIDAGYVFKRAPLYKPNSGKPLYYHYTDHE